MVFFLLLFFVAVAAAKPPSTLGRRLKPGSVHKELAEQDCGGVCGGLAVYPVRTGNTFYAEFDVPAYPVNQTDITFFIYFNIFFGDVKPDGKMNQFVPQLMLGEPLDGSTGPPYYHPIWNQHKKWVFGAQYFGEFFNKTSNKTQAFAATGKVVSCEVGEVLWTRFELSADWVWTLSMGVKGDAKRVSTVIADKPYMGLLESESSSWKEDIYNHTFVNGCWELYGVSDLEHYPQTGSHYDILTTTDHPGSIDWFTGWNEDEQCNSHDIPKCRGCPNSTFAEEHSPSRQSVTWNVHNPPVKAP